MISIEVILGLLFIHFVADFILQTDQQAITKSSGGYGLFAHVFVYVMPLIIFAMFYMEPGLALVFGIWNFVLHALTDYCSSNLGKWYWERKERKKFFIVLGLDQFLHYVVLFGTWSYLTSI